MVEFKGNERIEDVAIIGGLIGLQAMYAANSVLLSYLMTIGFQPKTLIILSSFATFLILAPLSFSFERSEWPKKITLKLWIKLLFISFGGVTLFQSLFLKGMNLTSPAMATAMPNLAPGFIFFIAWAFRLEKVELGCKYSRAKIAGTLLCVVGAILMSLMQSTFNEHTSEEFQYSTITLYKKSFDEQKIIGSIYLMAAVLVLSSNIVLQAAALTEFPAPVSLCATTSLIGAILTTIIQLIQESKIDFGLPFLSIEDLVGYSLLAGVISGGCVTFNTWAMKKRGPVLVSVFSPIGTLVSVVLSANTLETSMSLGSLAGTFIMFTGLYLVLWAKGKEGIPPNSDRFTESEYNNVEKPLLC